MNAPKNALVVGFDKAPILDLIPRDQFLLIDDGPTIDALSVQARRFDVGKHKFNPLKDMDDRKADAFIAVLNAAFPEGENTLTRRYSNHYLFKRLLQKPRRLDRLALPSKDPYERDAFEKIERILLSPVLKAVLNGPNLFRLLGGRIVARLDRAELGEFNCYVLGNLLISQYPGPVVVPDFGFYANPSHVSLIRQGRLIAGINAFDEVPKFRSRLLLVKDKRASRCTPEDAKVLAEYAHVIPNTNEYHDFIQRSIDSPTA